MTWLQPPGWVHAMIKDTWELDALRVTLEPASPNRTCTPYGQHTSKPCPYLLNYSASAQQCADGKRVEVRYMNALASPQSLSVDLVGIGAGELAAATATVTQIFSAEINGSNPAPSEPERISLRTWTLATPGGGGAWPVLHSDCVRSARECRQVEVPRSMCAYACVSSCIGGRRGNAPPWHTLLASPFLPRPCTSPCTIDRAG